MPLEQENSLNPKISIITVIYNAEEVLEKTLLSVFKQTYKNIEVIVIDGGSTDETLHIINKYNDSIDIFLSERDDGIYDAMNKGMDLATGDFITFLNADDEYYSETTVEELFSDIDEKTDVVYGDHISILNGKESYRTAKDFTEVGLLTNLTSIFCHQAFFIRKPITPRYNTDYSLKGELDWYFNILKRGDIVYKRKKIPVVYYERGGVGEQRYMLNLREMINVIKSQSGLYGLVLSSKQLLKYLVKVFLIITKRYDFAR